MVRLIKNEEYFKKLVEVDFALGTGRFVKSKVFTCLNGLPAGTAVDLAFDQSTSQTGIALKLHGGPVLVIADIVNRGLPSKEIFMIYLEDFVRSLVKGLDVRYVVYEDPVEHSHTISTRNVLLELRGFIKTLAVNIDELFTARFVEVPIGTWRKHFLASPEYRGRRRKTEDVKVATAEEVVKRFPQFEGYRNAMRGTPDSMDAVGILEGWTAEYFLDNKMRNIRVNKCMPVNYATNFYYDIIGIAPSEIRKYLQQRFGIQVLNRGYQLLAFNGELSLEDNVVRAISSFNEYCAILVTDRKDIQSVRWQAGKDLLPGEVYVIVAYRHHITNSLPVNSLPDSELEFWRTGVSVVEDTLTNEKSSERVMPTKDVNH